jgi:hypothetical protein
MEKTYVDKEVNTDKPVILYDLLVPLEQVSKKSDLNSIGIEHVWGFDEYTEIADGWKYQE